jgi:hypothetical protein
MRVNNYIIVRLALLTDYDITKSWVVLAYWLRVKIFRRYLLVGHILVRMAICPWCVWVVVGRSLKEYGLGFIIFELRCWRASLFLYITRSRPFLTRAVFLSRRPFGGWNFEPP